MLLFFLIRFRAFLCMQFPRTTRAMACNNILLQVAAVHNRNGVLRGASVLEKAWGTQPLQPKETVRRLTCCTLQVSSRLLSFFSFIIVLLFLDYNISMTFFLSLACSFFLIFSPSCFPSELFWKLPNFSHGLMHLHTSMIVIMNTVFQMCAHVPLSLRSPPWRWSAFRLLCQSPMSLACQERAFGGCFGPGILYSWRVAAKGAAISAFIYTICHLNCFSCHRNTREEIIDVKSSFFNSNPLSFSLSGCYKLSPYVAVFVNYLCKVWSRSCRWQFPDEKSWGRVEWGILRNKTTTRRREQSVDWLCSAQSCGEFNLPVDWLLQCLAHVISIELPYRFDSVLSYSRIYQMKVPSSSVAFYPPCCW